MMRADDRVVTKEELKPLKAKYLYAGADNLQYEQRKKLYSTLKKVMIYAGIIDHHVRVLPPMQGQKECTQIKGYRWVFKSPVENEDGDEHHPKNFDFSNLEYLNKRKTEFIIEFKKEPPKTLT